jgi:ABC-type oligopeptide transport system substrate-binding subunit
MKMFLKGEMIMIKSKKFIVVFAAFMLIAVLLTGCNPDTAGENELEGDAGISTPGTPYEEEPAETDDQTETDKQAETDNKKDEAGAATNVSGTLKSFDAKTGMITIDTQSNDKLELNVIEESKILINNLPATSEKLTDIIGSEVSVEYNAETNNVEVINIKG